MTQTIQKSIIHRPIEVVFDVATCLESCINWQAMMVEARKITPGSKGVGTQFHHKSRFMRIPIGTEPVITLYEPPHRFGYRNESGTFTFEVLFTFTAVDGGTRFDATMSSSAANRPIAEVAVPLLVNNASRQYDNDLHVLKTMMEGDLRVKVF